MPVAGYALMKKNGLHLEGMVAELDGSLILRKKSRGPEEKPEELGRRVAEDLLAAGAGGILERIYGGTT